jgi:hypothetical protein
MFLIKKMKEQKDLYQHQIDQWKVKYETALQEKTDLELEQSNKVKDIENRHKKRLQETENKYQQQVVDEVERYQVLLKSKEELHAKFQAHINSLQVQHEKSIVEVKDTYEGKFKEGQGVWKFIF